MGDLKHTMSGKDYLANLGDKMKLPIMDYVASLANKETLPTMECIASHANMIKSPTMPGKNYVANNAVYLNNMYPPQTRLQGQLCAHKDCEQCSKFIFLGGSIVQWERQKNTKMARADAKNLVKFLQNDDYLDAITSPTMQLKDNRGRWFRQLQTKTGEVSNLRYNFQGKCTEMNSVDSRLIYVTGVCFFGSQLRGVTENNKSVLFYHHLVSSHTSGEMIESVFLSEERCFSDIYFNQLFLSYQDAKNHAASVEKEFLFYVHIPTAEYLITSFGFKQHGLITTSALIQYWSILRNEHKTVVDRIKRSCPGSIVYSPMQGLVDKLLNKDNESYLLALLLKDVGSFKADVLQKEDIGRVGLEHDYYSTIDTYADLARYSYVSAFATANMRYPRDMVIACDNYFEMPISCQYKKHFAKQFGAVNVLSYLPLVTVHGDGNQLTTIFHTDFNQGYLHPLMWE